MHGLLCEAFKSLLADGIYVANRAPTLLRERFVSCRSIEYLRCNEVAGCKHHFIKQSTRIYVVIRDLTGIIIAF